MNNIKKEIKRRNDQPKRNIKQILDEIGAWTEIFNEMKDFYELYTETSKILVLGDSKGIEALAWQNNGFKNVTVCDILFEDNFLANGSCIKLEMDYNNIEGRYDFIFARNFYPIYNEGGNLKREFDNWLVDHLIQKDFPNPRSTCVTMFNDNIPSDVQLFNYSSDDEPDNWCIDAALT